MDRTRPLWSSRRFRTWSLLGALLVASVGVLLLAMSSRQGGPRPPLEIRVVGEQGKPLPGAEIRLRRGPGEGVRPGETWDPEQSLLTLPASGAPYAFAVLAPGRRLELLEGVADNRTVVLERGYVVRLRLSSAVPPVEEPLAIVMKVTPGADLPSEAGLDLSDLMEVRDAGQSDTPPLPRRGFGFAVSRQDGAAGILLPHAGTYAVTWGLLDKKAGTWFALQEGSRTEFQVADTADVQVFEVPVDEAAVLRTRTGLEERIRMLRER
jgi:hypothetical protein